MSIISVASIVVIGIGSGLAFLLTAYFFLYRNKANSPKATPDVTHAPITISKPSEPACHLFIALSLFLLLNSLLLLKTFVKSVQSDPLSFEN